MRCVALKDKQLLSPAMITDPVSRNGSVVIEVKKCGICGSDIHYWDIGQPQTLVMGHEFCGTVIDPGSRSDLKIGDRVTALPISPCGKCEACLSNNPQYCPDTWTKAVGLSLTNPGAYAEKTSISPDLTFKLPDNVSDDEAAMIEPMAVGYHAVNLGNIKKGDNVLVVGAGIIGQMCAMLAKKAGAGYVAIAETNPLRGEKSIKLGSADKFFNAKDEDYLEKVKAHNPYGFDVVFDCCGNSIAVTNEIICTKPNGTLILVGVSLDSITVPSSLIVTKELRVLGAIAYTKEEFKECIDMISNKQVELTKYIDDIVTLSDVQKSFERLTSGSDDAIKILIDPHK